MSVLRVAQCVTVVLVCSVLAVGCTLDTSPLLPDSGGARDMGVSTDTGAVADTGALPDSDVPADTATSTDTSPPMDTQPPDTGPTCMPSAELCNGLDDDCDGTIDDDTDCPCDRSTFDGHSYLFCDDPATWTSARDFCRAGGRGYELVTIDNEAENRWLDTEAEMSSRPWWWIGANGRAIEDVWVWVASGATLSPGYVNWQDGEPGNFVMDEDCCHMNVDETGVTSGIPGPWHDGVCTARVPFICEAGP